MAEILNKLNPETGKYESVSGGAFQSAPTDIKPVSTPAITSPSAPVTTPVATPSYTDLQGRQISQVAYEAQKKAGTDVSGYKQVEPKAEVIKAETQVNPVVSTNMQVQPEIKQPDIKKVEPGIIQPLPVSEYQDNSTDRLNQIVSNLNQYKSTNPEYMKDIDTFKKTFRIDPKIRTQEQINRMMDWYKGYEKGTTISNTPTSDLVKKGISNSDLERLKTNDPNKYTEVKAEQEKTKTYYNLKNELYKTEAPKTVMEKIEEPIGSNIFFDDYKKTINSEEVKGLQTEMSNREGEIKQLRLDLATMQKDIEKQYEGTGASRSKINAIVADAQTEINNKISALGIDYQTTADKYNSIVKAAKDTMDMGLQQRQLEISDRNQRMQELGFYYQYDPVGMTERANTEFEIKNPDIDSPDANTARRALNNELAKYYEQFGDIIIRPQSQALNDILAQSKAEGLSLSQALKKNFTDPLQAKNLYSAKLQKNMGLDFGDYQLTQGADGNWNMQSKAQVSSTGYPSIQGSGNIAQVSLSGKNVGLDTAAAPSIQEAFSDPIMQGVVVGQGHRDQVATIKSMASKYGISFNESNPAETARTLTAAGHKVAVPGYSKHETGMAIDLYDANGKAPSVEQVKVLNSKGWYQTAGSGDMGHFEYVGTGGSQYSDQQKAVMEQMDVKSITKIEEDILKKNGLTATDVFKYNEGKQAGKWTQGLDDTEIKRINTVIDDVSNDPTTKTFKKTQEAYIFAKGLKEGVSATDNQALIYAFAKAMDPDSVVREGEYATVQKYSQTRGDKLDMDINRILNGQEFISETAKKNIVETIKSKYNAGKETYNSVRNNKIRIINDIAGKDIGNRVIPNDIMELEVEKLSGSTINYSVFGQGAGSVTPIATTSRSLIK